MTFGPIEISIIGEDNIHSTLLHQFIEQDKNIEIISTESNCKKMLSLLPLKKVPDVILLIKKDATTIHKLINELHRYHPTLPIMVFGKDSDDEFTLLNKKVFAYLVPDQCKEYLTAIRVVALKQHFTSEQYWNKHDLVMSHEQSGKAIDKMSQLPEELMIVAHALYNHPESSNEVLGRDVLHLSEDTVYYKIRKLSHLLGLNGKKDLTAFLVQFYSKNE